MAYDEKTAERIRRLLAGRANVTEQKLMGGLCFLINDNMVCSVSGKGGLLIRVGAEAQEKVLHEPHTAPMKMGQRTMKAFVRLAPAGYRRDADLKKWIERGIDFVSTLPKKLKSRRDTRGG